MHQLTPLPVPAAARRRQRGITLIESLVAIVVAALGVLGVVGAQLRTLSDTQTTVRRAQAIRLIEDLGERMHANPNALIVLPDYVSDFSDSPTAVDCESAACAPADLAARDIAVWKQNVAANLPLGSASVFLAPADTVDGNRRQLGVMLAWRENERAGTRTDQIDATQVRAADGTLSAGAGSATDAIACPAERICHLQYIPVAARCAPYFSPGLATPQIYCPGA